MIDLYGNTETRFLCREATPFPRQCDVLNFGNLVKACRNLKLWPGNVEDLVLALGKRNIVNISSSLKTVRGNPYCEKIQAYSGTRPSGLTDKVHKRCGSWVTYLHNIADSKLVDEATKASEVCLPQVEAQRLKLQPETVSLDKFQSSASSWGS